MSSSYVQADDDPLNIINLSVWETLEQLHDFVYRTAHTPFLRRRREWFQQRRAVPRVLVGAGRPHPHGRGGDGQARAARPRGSERRRVHAARSTPGAAAQGGVAARLSASAAVAPGRISGMHHVAPAAARAAGSGCAPPTRATSSEPGDSAPAASAPATTSGDHSSSPTSARPSRPWRATRRGPAVKPGAPGDPDRHARRPSARPPSSPDRRAGRPDRPRASARAARCRHPAPPPGPCRPPPARRTARTRHSCRPRGRAPARRVHPPADPASSSPGRRAAPDGAGGA